MSSPCPFCNRIIPLPELEWHANDHLVEEEVARDRELAQKIAHVNDHLLEEELRRDMELARSMEWALSSPRLTDQGLNYVNSFEVFDGETSNASTSTSNGNTIDLKRRENQEKVDCLVHLQIKSTFYKVEGGLMQLLRRCLELENGRSSSIICGYVDHFQSLESEDLGWGCGWRNIQMLSSYLLKHRQEVKEVMFGGSGFVPDISSLQRWLEIAWEMGFDVFGSNSFNNKIYGSTKWIGTAECATLFRSFGLRARIADFGCKEIKQEVELNCRGKRKTQQVYGPMDKFMDRRNSDDLQVRPSKLQKFMQMNNHTLTNLDKLKKFSVKKSDGHQLLFEWVWNYFADSGVKRSDNSEWVMVSMNSPLYFQHNGHSRTIVGIQIQKRLDGTPERHFLLVLDPSHSTTALEKSLRENIGWQRFIKRGVQTLRKPLYQLCFIDSGIAHGEELEQLKSMDSISYEV